MVETGPGKNTDVTPVKVTDKDHDSIGNIVVRAQPGKLFCCHPPPPPRINGGVALTANSYAWSQCIMFKSDGGDSRKTRSKGNS